MPLSHHPPKRNLDESTSHLVIHVFIHLKLISGLNSYFYHHFPLFKSRVSLFKGREGHSILSRFDNWTKLFEDIVDDQLDVVFLFTIHLVTIDTPCTGHTRKYMCIAHCGIEERRNMICSMYSTCKKTSTI